MSLSIIKRKDKEYLYFLAGSKKRLYLGTAEDPKIENIKEALSIMRGRIEKNEEELRKLESLLPIKSEGYMGLEEKPMIYKLIIFDLYGVVYQKPWYESGDEKISVSTWDVLFQELGPTMYNMHEQLKDNFRNEVFNNYVEWTENACSVLKSFGLKEKVFNKVIDSRMFNTGALELFKELKKNKVLTAVVSGSFDALAERAAKLLGGIDSIKAHCKLNFDSRGFLDSWEIKRTDYEDRIPLIEGLIAKYRLSLQDCVYIGDDVNDIKALALKSFGLTIAFNCTKYQVQEFANVVIKSHDLRDIIPHLKFGSKA